MFKKRSGAGAPATLRKREVAAAATGDEPGAGGFQQYAAPLDEAGGGEGVAVHQQQSVASDRAVNVLGASTLTAGRGERERVGVAVVYESAKDAAPVVHAGDATHTSEVDTAQDRDARAILERTIQAKADGVGVAVGEGKAYRGQASYETSFVKTDVATAVGASKAIGTQGPLRAPSFVRTTTRFDYQPDICKDYKETGFCGYGDSCKFLHDRSDYKAGWQQEKEWDEQQAKKKKKLEDARSLMSGGADDGDGDGDAEGMAAAGIKGEGVGREELPHSCLICRSGFTNPVVTMCGHYFCSACIMAHHKTSSKCPATNCGKQTLGVFNRASKLMKKIESAPAQGAQARVVSSGQWEDV